MTYLSAWKVSDISGRFAGELHDAWLGAPGMQLMPTETATNGGNTVVFAGNIARVTLSAHLFYDVEVSVSGTGDGKLEFIYEDYDTQTLIFPSGTSGRKRGLLPVLALPAGIPAAVPLIVKATAPASGTIQARVYWLDEIADLSGYVPLSNANALANGAISTVGPAIDALQDNAIYLGRLLHRRGVAGFRPSELDFMAGQTSQSSTYRLKCGGYGGYLYVVWAIYALKYSSNAKIDVTLTVNSAVQVGTLTVDENYGFSEKGFVDKIAIVDALYPMGSVQPTPKPQHIERIDISAVRTGDIFARITPMFMCWVNEDDIGTFPRPKAGDTVQDLSNLYLIGRSLAGDDGTGYGKDGYDLAGGMPVGFAIADGRSQAMAGHLTHSGAYASVINMEKSQYQVISMRHTGAPHLLLKGKGLGIYYLREEEEGGTMLLDSIGSVEDAEEGELFDISDIPSGAIYIVAADLTQNTENAESYLDGAWEVYADV